MPNEPFQMTKPRLMGVVLMVFVARKHLLKIQRAESKFCRTGFSGYSVSTVFFELVCLVQPSTVSESQRRGICSIDAGRRIPYYVPMRSFRSDPRSAVVQNQGKPGPDDFPFQPSCPWFQEYHMVLNSIQFDSSNVISGE